MVTLVEKKVVIVLLALMMTFSSGIVISPVHSDGNAVLSFSPVQSTTAFPQPVTLNVTLSNVVNLNAWQIKVAFNPALLTYSNMSVPDDNLLGPLGGTSGLAVLPNNKAGYVLAFLALDGSQVVNGSGTLCQMTFNVSRPSVSAVTFADIGIVGPYGGTALTDSNLNKIPFSTLGGTVQVGASGFQSFTFSCMKKGMSYNVTLFTNSTAQSFSYNETTDTATFFLSNPVGTVGSCSVSIPIAMMNATLAIFVNGSATYSLQSSDGLNSFLVFSYGQSTARVDVLATVLGDLNGDRRVNMKDLGIVARAFGSTPGSPRWNPAADVNGDAKVDIKDLGLVARFYGRTYEPS